MTTTQKIILSAVAFVLACASVAFWTPALTHGEIVDNATMATSSVISVGTQEVKTLFAAHELCANRIISTGGKPIMTSWDSTMTPNAVRGHQQAASTTVVYSASQWGCGAVTVYGHDATSTITISESRL